MVTGASSGIGLELATTCAQERFDLLIAADRPEIQAAAETFRSHPSRPDRQMVAPRFDCSRLSDPLRERLVPATH
jgi:NAD(P)-dependent dehydrogenase (short-subunit alcohol dehydrogenase family)